MNELINILREIFKEPLYILMVFIVAYLFIYAKDIFLATYETRYSYKLNKNKIKIENLLWLKNNTQISSSNDLVKLVDEQIKQAYMNEIMGINFPPNIADLVVHKYHELPNIGLIDFKRAAKYLFINNNGILDINITTCDKVERYIHKTLSFILICLSIFFFIFGSGSFLSGDIDKLWFILPAFIAFMSSLFVDSGTWAIQSAIKIKKAMDEQIGREDYNE